MRLFRQSSIWKLVLYSIDCWLLRCRQWEEWSNKKHDIHFPFHWFHFIPSRPPRGHFHLGHVHPALPLDRWGKHWGREDERGQIRQAVHRRGEISMKCFKRDDTWYCNHSWLDTDISSLSPSSSPSDRQRMAVTLTSQWSPFVLAASPSYSHVISWWERLIHLSCYNICWISVLFSVATIWVLSVFLCRSNIIYATDELYSSFVVVTLC